MDSLDKKCYQLIISRLDGAKIPQISYMEMCVELVRKGIGGFIIFGGEKGEVKKCIRDLQSLSAVPLFIASDIERGAGQQIEGAISFPGQMAVAAALDRNSPESLGLLKDMISAVAGESVDIGINMPLIPVMDVNQNPDNPIICTRAFSDNPEVVAWYGSVYITTLESKGLISCAKHFPGHGDTSTDSHLTLPVISKPIRELKDADLLPFAEAVRAGASSIMAGHISIPAIDNVPASLSEKVLTGLLRKDLGFEGLIVTDALNMHALDSIERVPSKCVSAGADILLHPADADRTVNELTHAVTSGGIDEKKIDMAVERIGKCKERLKYLHGSVPDYETHRQLSAGISDRSITLLKGRPERIPFKDWHDISLLFCGDEKKYDLSALKHCTGEYINLQHHREGPLKETVFIALFTNIAAWEGSSGIGAHTIDAIKGVISKSRFSVVVSFGSPYVLRHFPEADMLIAAYDTTALAQASVIKCLRGEAGLKGVLPVRLRLN